MQSDACPDSNTLERLLLGKLPAGEREHLGEHLLQCDQCASRADTIAATDELTDALQSAPLTGGDDAHLAQAIERARALRSQADTVKTDETLTVRAGSAAARPPDDRTDGAAAYDPIDFLRPAELPGEIGRLGDYRVLEVLGTGGMGVVFRAEDPRLKRQVALKAMKPAVAASRSAKDRFVREAQATASIDHDNIVHIYQVGEDLNIPFIAMQFLRGESLQTRLERERRLDQREVLRIGREVAAGLAAAHHRGLIHRDIKPDNIWIEAQTGRAKVLDFGLVRPANEDTGLTQTGMILGTPRYMAPEQAQGLEVDHRCDLFSLGSVLYHLAAGRAPFDGGNLTATLIAVANADPEPVDRVAPGMHPDLARLIMWLLCKEADRRPQSASDVAKALAEVEKALMANAPEVTSHEGRQAFGSPPTAAWKAQAFEPRTKSRKPILLAGAIVAVALGLFFALWAAGIIFKVEVEGGTIIVEIDGSGKPVEVSVAEDKSITISDPNDGRPITVSVDRANNQLRLDKQGFQIVVKQFSLESPDGRRVTVSFIPRKAAEEPPSVRPDDPHVITVAQDGSAQCSTINEALARVGTRGATIRVVDDAVYRESLLISNPDRHSDLTLEAPRGATIAAPGIVVRIRKVQGVTVRGFALRTESNPAAGCLVHDGASGITLEDLIVAGKSSGYGVALEGLHSEDRTPAVVVRQCSFRNLGLGIRISGIENDYKTAMTCRGIVIAGNRFESVIQSVVVEGDVRDLTIAGNLIRDATATGIQLNNLLDSAGNIQIVNNTHFNCVGSVQLWDTDVGGTNVRLLNNLTLNPDGTDWTFLDSGGSRHIAQGPGDGRSVLEHWRLAHNWREIEPPAGDAEPGWIPPSAQDTLANSIELLSRDPHSSDFLRPSEDSPLATGGAGRDDPTLPEYVGAVPPRGAPPWDWSKHASRWGPQPAPADAGVLTVAQDGSGQFTSIVAALDKARRGMTIRVLDDAVYSETLFLRLPDAHAELTLEATNHATIEAVRAGPAVLAVVPGVRIRGFRFQSRAGIQSIFCTVGLHCAGTIVEDIECVADPSQAVLGVVTKGVTVENALISPNEPPVIVRNNRFAGVYFGVQIRGLAADYRTPEPCRGVMVVDNHFDDCAKSIIAEGDVRDVLIAGNQIVRARLFGMQLEQLVGTPDNIVLVNNTLFESQSPFRLWDDGVRGINVRVANNLSLSSTQPDWLFFDSIDRETPRGPGDVAELLRSWQFARNYREGNAPAPDDQLPGAWIPPSEQDNLSATIEVSSRTRDEDNFLRPAADSVLATAGWRDESLTLPPYVGALPPGAETTWDWTTTWRSMCPEN